MFKQLIKRYTSLNEGTIKKKIGQWEAQSAYLGKEEQSLVKFGNITIPWDYMPLVSSTEYMAYVEERMKLPEPSNGKCTTQWVLIVRDALTDKKLMDKEIEHDFWNISNKRHNDGFLKSVFSKAEKELKNKKYI